MQGWGPRGHGKKDCGMGAHLYKLYYHAILKFFSSILCAIKLIETNPQPNATITSLPLDLESLESVRNFAAKFQELKLPLHLLICNAGIMATPYGTTKDGLVTSPHSLI